MIYTNLSLHFLYAFRNNGRLILKFLYADKNFFLHNLLNLQIIGNKIVLVIYVLT